MAKIDYSKAEREMHEALQRMRIKNLEEGKTITSKRASEFYGLEEERPRPVPEESVAKLLREEAAREEAAEKKREEKQEQLPSEGTPPSESKTSEQPLPTTEIEEEEEPTEPPVRRPPMYDVIHKSKAQSNRLPRPSAPPLPEVPPADTFREPISPLYILRQHILWLKRKHYDNRYELLGTTREEIMSFRRAARLSEEQLVRIKELNSRAEEVKAGIMAEQGLQTEEKEIEKQKQKHKTKRFNVKDTWLQL